MRNEPTPKIEAGAEPEKLGYSNWGEWFRCRFGISLEDYAEYAKENNLRELIGKGKE